MSAKQKLGNFLWKNYRYLEYRNLEKYNMVKKQTANVRKFPEHEGEKNFLRRLF